MKYYYAALLAVLFALFGCNTSVVRNSLSRAEGLMAESPDSAKTVLDSIKRTDLKNRALKARFALLYSQAMDKCYIDTDNDSLISVALNYYSKRGSNHEKALAYYYNSAVAKNAKDIDKEVEYLVRAQEYAEKTDDAYLKGLIYSLLAQKYYMQFSFEEALLLYEKSAKEFEKTGNLSNQLYAYSGIHNSLLCLDRAQESIPAARKALELAQKLNNINVGLINAIFVKPVDLELLKQLKNTKLIIIEEVMKIGSLASLIMQYNFEYKLNMDIISYGIDDLYFNNR